MHVRFAHYGPDVLWVPKMPAAPADLWFRARLDHVFRLLYRLLVGLTRLAAWTGRAKELEIMVRRHQLAVLQRNTKPPNLTTMPGSSSQR